jgi:Flp pilus assembly protein CpaB
MKWSIVGLLSLGLVAAVCAFFLVLSLQDKAEPRRDNGDVTLTLPPQPTEPRLVDILLAARDVAAYSRLSTEDVRVEKVALQEAEDLLRKGAFRDPLQVAGRVTEVPIQKDELVVPDMFVRKESGLLITTALAQGKRAVSLSLTDSMGIEGILYPGCYVDVIASMKVSSGSLPLSMTLLQSAYVLSVGDRSVVSPEGSGNEGDAGTAMTGSNRPSVTLLVTPSEAEVLKLAMAEGSVTLVLRDPRDTETHSPEPGTRLADLSPTIAALEQLAVARAKEEEADRQSKRQREALLAGFEVEKARADKELEDLKREHDRLQALRQLEAVTSPPWKADVIRGGTLESKVFENPIKKGGS